MFLLFKEGDVQSRGAFFCLGIVSRWTQDKEYSELKERKQNIPDIRKLKNKVCFNLCMEQS